MKMAGTSFALVTILLAIAMAWESGVTRQAWDSRSVVEDGVIGADYWVVKVDGMTTDRITHGLVVTRVPLALVEPGDRVLSLRERDSPMKPTDSSIEWRTRIEKGTDYRIEKGPDGHPRLVARN